MFQTNGIDGSPGDDADARKVLIHGCNDGEVDGHQQQHRRMDQPVDEPRGNRDGVDVGLADRGGSNRVPGIGTRTDLRQVALVGGFDQRPEGGAFGEVADNDDPPALPVAATGGEAGVVEDPVEHLVRHGISREVPSCERGAHDIVEFHYIVP